MKLYNVVFEDVSKVMKFDIKNYLYEKIGFISNPDADITYKISVIDSKFQIERQSKLINRIVPLDEFLWNECIFHIPKKAGVVLVSSSFNYYNITTYLSHILSYSFYSFDSFLNKENVTEHKPSNDYVIIGDDNLDELCQLKGNVELYVVSPDFDRYDNKTLNRFDVIGILSPDISSRILQLNNVNVLDITEVVVQRIYNDFYNIRE